MQFSSLDDMSKTKKFGFRLQPEAVSFFIKTPGIELLSANGKFLIESGYYIKAGLEIYVNRVVAHGNFINELLNESLEIWRFGRQSEISVLRQKQICINGWNIA